MIVAVLGASSAWSLLLPGLAAVRLARLPSFGSLAPRGRSSASLFRLGWLQFCHFGDRSSVPAALPHLAATAWQSVTFLACVIAGVAICNPARRRDRLN